MPLSFLVKSAKGMKFNSEKGANFLSKVLHFVMTRKAKTVWKKIGGQVLGKRILDIGMGSGSLSFFLKKKGFEMTSIDVDNLSIYEDLKPIIYNGDKIPFKDNSFEVAVIIHVLHHCNDGVKVLAEAKRVARRVIFIEDTYRNWFEWLIVSVSDAVNNGELWFHKYRTMSEWKEIIRCKKWRVVNCSEWSEWGVAAVYGRYCMFVIE